VLLAARRRLRLPRSGSVVTAEAISPKADRDEGKPRVCAFVGEAEQPGRDGE
jgi:hypothetical protein